MLQSLRARLAFLFLGTLVLATVIASVVVVSLYQSYNRDQTESALRKQVEGVASYYQGAFTRTFGKAREPAPGKITVKVFNQVSDAKLYYGGPRLFQVPGARALKSVVPDFNPGTLTRTVAAGVQVKPPGRARPISASGRPFSAATSRSARSCWQSRWRTSTTPGRT